MTIKQGTAVLVSTAKGTYFGYFERLVIDEYGLRISLKNGRNVAQGNLHQKLFEGLITHGIPSFFDVGRAEDRELREISMWSDISDIAKDAFESIAPSTWEESLNSHWLADWFYGDGIDD